MSARKSISSSSEVFNPSAKAVVLIVWFEGNGKWKRFAGWESCTRYLQKRQIQKIIRNGFQFWRCDLICTYFKPKNLSLKWSLKSQLSLTLRYFVEMEYEYKINCLLLSISPWYNLFMYSYREKMEKYGFQWI